MARTARTAATARSSSARGARRQRPARRELSCRPWGAVPDASTAPTARRPPGSCYIRAGESYRHMIVEARGVVKRFGERVAVDGIDLDVQPGACFGLLGP